ncbi:MAG: glycosyltransferase family 2 protein [Tissierellia bacterium]|nr:glycosyltransferase family 2 protein [Tissierellia bacterium]
MQKGLVSIIVPVYNAERFINDTIKTVFNQTYKNWELIFVNDCSTDNSHKIIEKYFNYNKNIKILNTKINSGPAIARNLGIELAKGQYITFLDADDLWIKDKLKKQIEFMKNKDCCFSFTGYEYADCNGIGTGKIVRVPEFLNYRQALKNTTISTITVMFSLSKINKERIQMLNVDCEDTATWWKVLKQGYIAYGLDESLSLYRRSRNTLSSNKFIAIKRIWNLYRNVEKLNILYSSYNFSLYAFNAVRRRI